MKNPFLIGKLVYLRAPEPGDEINIAISENHPDPRENLFYAFPTSIGNQLDKLTREHTNPDTIVLVICTRERDQVIGKTAFYRIDWVGRMAVYYLAISETANWQKGYGSEVTRLMIEYAFNTLNLNRIQLHVFKNNKAAIRVYENAGFVIEGTLREAMYHKGGFCDFYVMGLLRKEYSRSNTAKTKS